MLVSALPSRLCECICSDSPGHADQLDALTCPHLPSLSSLKADSKATLAVISGSECPHLVGHIPAYRGSCTHMCTCAQSSWKFTYTFSITVVAAPPLLDFPLHAAQTSLEDRELGSKAGSLGGPVSLQEPVFSLLPLPSATFLCQGHADDTRESIKCHPHVRSCHNIIKALDLRDEAVAINSESD